METTIKLRPNEIDLTLLENLQTLTRGKKYLDITISLKEFDADNLDKLEESIDSSYSEENLTYFTFEEIEKRQTSVQSYS